MAFSAGSSLGSYEIIALLGAGGMGEVYRAKDTKLGRDVALKILPATFTNDPERVASFRREAQVLASLNHPHIGQIYGLEEANGTQFLVLELVDGESLERTTVAERAEMGRPTRSAAGVSSDNSFDSFAAARTDHERNHQSRAPQAVGAGLQVRSVSRPAD
jgi:serine/threonine protein kinase